MRSAVMGLTAIRLVLAGVMGVVVPGGSAYAQEPGPIAAARANADAGATDEVRFDWTRVESPALAAADLPLEFAIFDLSAGNSTIVAAHNCSDPCLGLLRSTDGYEWEQVAVDGPGDEITALAWAGDAFLAIAHAGGRTHPRTPEHWRPCHFSWCRVGASWHLYRSPDGIDWDHARIAGTQPRDSLMAIAGGSAGIIAAGCVLSKRDPFASQFYEGVPTGCDRGLLLRSDEGLSWERTEVEDVRWFDQVALDGTTAVVAGFRGDLAGDAGNDHGTGRPVVMDRTPGKGWSPPRSLLREGTLPADLVKGPGGGFVLAASGWCRPIDDYDAMHTWLITSDDGRDWRSARGCPSKQQRHSPWYDGGLASADSLVFATGLTESGGTTIWWSHDGSTWQREIGAVVPAADSATVTAGGVVIVPSPSDGAFWLGRAVPVEQLPVPELATRVELENELLDRAWPTECQRWRRDDEPFAFGALAAVRCGRPDRSIDQLALFTFPDPGSLDRYWDRRMSDLRPRPPASESACSDGGVGISSWEHGRITCYIPRSGSRVAKIRWTDERTDTYGIVDAADRDILGLYHWWLAEAPRASAPTTTRLAPDVQEPVPLDPRIPVTPAEQEAYLLGDVADPNRCETLDRKSLRSRVERPRVKMTGTRPPTVVAGVRCPPGAISGADDFEGSVDLYLFGNDTSLDDWWDRMRAYEMIFRSQYHGPDSGTLRTCFDRETFSSAEATDTTWRATDAAEHGRLACWFIQGRHDRSKSDEPQIRWTVAQDLIGGSANVDPTWFERAHPERVQSYPQRLPGVLPRRPFIEPSELQPLSNGVMEAVGNGGQATSPSSPGGLPSGVIFRFDLSPCHAPGSTLDVDGSFWVPISAANPEGKAIRSKPAQREFKTGRRVEFLKLADDTAQLRTPGGFVIGYERHDHPLPSAVCRWE